MNRLGAGMPKHHPSTGCRGPETPLRKWLDTLHRVHRRSCPSAFSFILWRAEKPVCLVIGCHSLSGPASLWGNGRGTDGSWQAKKLWASRTWGLHCPRKFPFLVQSMRCFSKLSGYCRARRRWRWEMCRQRKGPISDLQIDMVRHWVRHFGSRCWRRYRRFWQWIPRWEPVAFHHDVCSDFGGGSPRACGSLRFEGWSWQIPGRSLWHPMLKLHVPWVIGELWQDEMIWNELSCIYFLPFHCVCGSSPATSSWWSSDWSWSTLA